MQRLLTLPTCSYPMRSRSTPNLSSPLWLLERKWKITSFTTEVRFSGHMSSWFLDNSEKKSKLTGKVNAHAARNDIDLPSERSVWAEMYYGRPLFGILRTRIFWYIHSDKNFSNTSVLLNSTPLTHFCFWKFCPTFSKMRNSFWLVEFTSKDKLEKLQSNLFCWENAEKYSFEWKNSASKSQSAVNTFESIFIFYYQFWKML